MIRALPFGAFAGFSDTDRPGTSYYTQGLTQSQMGIGTLYSMVNKRDSVAVSGMGNITYFASGPGGAIFAQDDNGNVLKEGTPGVYDFTIVRSPGGNGCGLMGDQYGNLFYANGSSNNQLGKFDGSTWTDNYQSLNIGQHPMDTYEDLRVIANVSSVAVLFADNSFNNAALSLPSGMALTCVRSGPTGILLGANFGYQGAIILWDGNLLRAKTPWKWVKGQILAIDRYGANWIVKTTRAVYLTNGYTVKILFNVMDDPLSFKSYDNTNVRPQQILVVNDTLVFLNPVHANGPLSYELGRLKPGLYIYHLLTGSWDYIPAATGNTVTVLMNSAFADVNANNRILIGYRDPTIGKNYIASLQAGAGTTSTYISELLGIGKPHYQRMYFGPTDKIAEAVVLNLSMLSFITDPAVISFSCALKVYDFKRQLWGRQLTNHVATAGNIIRVDGTNTSFSKGVVGDEVTVLEGVNAGKIAHIMSIANAGLSTEAWTLDTTFASDTETNININVQPWHFVQKKTFTTLAQLKTCYFDVKNSIRGKQFLIKLVFDGMGTNMQVEINTSYFIWDDIGYDQIES